MNSFENIDNSWSLFLDRDGVINKYLPEDYVKTISEFVFEDGVLDALKDLSNIFGKIIIVTNQRGIARGLMTEQDLYRVHEYMLENIRGAGGRIDGIFFCPHNRDDNCACRKPRTGLALQAKEKFPDMDFSRSIIAGDSKSDMEFGENCGMHLAFITGHHGSEYKNAPVFSSLSDFRKSIIGSGK